MTKQIKQLLILVGVLVVLLGAYIVLRVWNAGAEERAEAQADYVLTLEDIQRLTWDYSGEDLDFLKSGESWTWAPDSAFPLEESNLTGLEETLASLKAQRVIEAPDALADYGLDTPDMTLTVETGSDTVKLLIGDMTGSDYYVMVEGEDRVYTIDSTLITYLECSLMDMMVLPDIPSMSESNVEQVEVTLTDGTTHQLTKVTETREETVETDTGETDENGEAVTETATQTVTVYTWYLDGEALSDGAVDDYLTDLGALYVSAAHAYRAESSEVISCGLTAAERLTIVLTQTDEDGETVEEQVDLRVGNDDTSGSYVYVTLNDDSDTPTIYLMNADRLESLLDLSRETLEATVSADSE